MNKLIILSFLLFNNFVFSENSTATINAGLVYHPHSPNFSQVAQFDVPDLVVFGFSDQYLYSGYRVDLNPLKDLKSLKHLTLSSGAYDFSSTITSFYGFDSNTPGEVSKEQWKIVSSLPLTSLTLANISYLDFRPLSFKELAEHPTLETLSIIIPWNLNDQQFKELNQLKVHLCLNGQLRSIEQLLILSELESLTLQSFNFSPELIEQMHYITLPGLKYLKIAPLNGYLKGFRPFTFAPNVVHLDLGNTNITGATVNELKDMPYLEEVLLGHTGITSGAVKNLSKISTLRKIDLAGTNIKGADFTNLKNIEELNLSGTNISREDLHTLKGLTQLKLLNLSQLNSATVRPQDIQELMQALPQCKVIP